MAIQGQALASIDERSYFEQALAYGVANGVLGDSHCSKILQDGPKGIVQIANHFGTAYLQASLQTAATRMVHLISLYLEDQSDGNLQVAAVLLRDHSLLSHSRGGSEMLKRLNALPQDAQLLKRQASPAEEKAFVDDRTFASPYSLAEYRKAYSERIETQQQIDFARWIAQQFNTPVDDDGAHHAEEFINTAMLVWYVGQAPLGFPTKSGFVKLVNLLRKPAFKPSPAAFERCLAAAPEEFKRRSKAAMQGFTKTKLPDLKCVKTPPADFLFGDRAGLYFVLERLDEEVGEFDQMVAQEWVRITKGKSDPETMATIFLLIATGQAPKASALKKDAQAIISQFRASGFDSAAVCQFIDEHAPFEQRRGLKSLWLDDLKPEAEVHLADPDADDTYMDRALPYLKQTLVATWKGRNS